MGPRAGWEHDLELAFQFGCAAVGSAAGYGRGARRGVDADSTRRARVRGSARTRRAELAGGDVTMVLSARESDQVVQWLQATRMSIQARSPVRSPTVLADADAMFIDLESYNISVHAKLTAPATRHAAPARGTRDGVVMLHGMCSSTYTWRHLQQPLADLSEQRVLAFDRPPFGLSTRPLRRQVRRARRTSESNPYSLKFGAHMTRDLMDKLEMPVATIVAHSLGATAALEFALAYPERVNALVLIAPSVRFQSSSSNLLRADVRRLLGLPVIGASIIQKSLAPLLKCSHAFDRAVSRNFYRPHRIYSEEFVRCYIQPMLAPGWVQGVQQALRALEPYDYLSSLRVGADQRLDASIPVLIIAGAYDAVLPRGDAFDFALTLREAGSDVTYEVVPDCGHVPQEEQPESVHAIVRDWLSHHNLVSSQLQR